MPTAVQFLNVKESRDQTGGANEAKINNKKKKKKRKRGEENDPRAQKESRNWLSEKTSKSERWKEGSKLARNTRQTPSESHKTCLP